MSVILRLKDMKSVAHKQHICEIMLFMRNSILHTGTFFHEHHDSCAVSLS